VTGEEWLERVFDPALRVGDPRFAELRGALRALFDCGVLSQDLTASANKQLDLRERERHELARRGSITRVDGRTIVGVNVGEHLEGSLTPGRALGDVDGLTVVLAGVWLWTSRLVLRLEAVENELTAALDSEFDSAFREYEDRWRAHRAGAQMDDEELNPPAQPSVARLGALPLSVSDDLGTRYHAFGKATGGPHPWRSEWRFAPGVAASATTLEVALEGDDRSERQCLELVLPARAVSPTRA
jgi:hypothetical protein